MLRPLLRQLDREAGLLDLAVERLLLADVEVAHELLRDRRAALDDLPGAEVRPRSARDADVVDAAVLLEAPVLDRDGRARQPLRHAAASGPARGCARRGSSRAATRRRRRRTSSAPISTGRSEFRSQLAESAVAGAEAGRDRNHDGGDRERAEDQRPARRRRATRAARFRLRPRWARMKSSSSSRGVCGRRGLTTAPRLREPLGDREPELALGALDVCLARDPLAHGDRRLVRRGRSRTPRRRPSRSEFTTARGCPRQRHLDLDLRERLARCGSSSCGSSPRRASRSGSTSRSLSRVRIQV